MKKNKEAYDFSERERYWQEFWERAKIYEFNPHAPGKLYSIDTPPPTVSGALHLGHVFSYTQAEVIARYRRMAGFNVRYPFGLDNNGLPTERLVEKELGVKGEDTDLKTFIEMCLSVTNGYTKKYESLFKSLGFNVDWRLEYSTISPEVQKLSQTAFRDLFSREKIYRSEAPALYCHECKTAVAQAEVEDKEKDSVFYDLVFQKADGNELIISTTRPELLPACVAVFVHPEDKRYADIVGSTVTTSLGIQVPLLADQKVSIEKGSGAVMCCTYGDEQDLKWVRQYQLPEKTVISQDGRIINTQENLELNGLSIKDARRVIIEKLKEKGSVRAAKPIVHAVGVHERCGTPIEIVPTMQWFIKMLEMKPQLLQAADQINWYPAHMKKRFIDWVENLKWDWCISRERFYGIPIPAFVCQNCETVVIPDVKDLPIDPKVDEYSKECPHCHESELKPETGVFDTWFTSALSPEVNNYNEFNKNLAGEMIPMSMRPQAHDIIRSWTVYTILMSLYLRESVPWKDLMISGHVLLRQGEKISKKSGGGKYRPEDLIAAHSADAIRYAVCGAGLGKDGYFEEKEIDNGKRLVTKLVNAGKFALANLSDFDPSTKLEEGSAQAFDQWILTRMLETASRMTQEFEKYEFNKALIEFEKFFWLDFADNYLEIVKGRLYALGGEIDPKERLSAQHTLYQTFLGILKMISPFLPHISEELFHSRFIQTGENLFEGQLKSGVGEGFFSRSENTESVHISSWPTSKESEPKKTQKSGASEFALDVITQARKFKSERKLKMSAPLERIVILGDKEQIEPLQDFVGDLKFVTKAQEIETRVRSKDTGEIPQVTIELASEQ